MSEINQLQKSFPTSLAVTVVDLRDMGTPDRKLDVGKVCNLDIEIPDCIENVTIDGKGPFASSKFLPVIEGSIESGGGKLSINGYALAELRFTRSGTEPMTINICRQIVS